VLGSIQQIVFPGQTVWIKIIDPSTASQLFDCFVVTEAPEIDLLRSVPSKLLNKYQIGSDDSIENEYSAEMTHKCGFGQGDYPNYDYCLLANVIWLYGVNHVV